MREWCNNFKKVLKRLALSTLIGLVILDLLVFGASLIWHFGFPLLAVAISSVIGMVIVVLTAAILSIKRFDQYYPLVILLIGFFFIIASLPESEPYAAFIKKYISEMNLFGVGITIYSLAITFMSFATMKKPIMSLEDIEDQIKGKENQLTELERKFRDAKRRFDNLKNEINSRH